MFHLTFDWEQWRSIFEGLQEFGSLRISEFQNSMLSDFQELRIGESYFKKYTVFMEKKKYKNHSPALPCSGYLQKKRI